MACWIKKNIISITKEDSLWTKLAITDADGNPYVPDPNDEIWFALKGSTNDSEQPLVLKRIDPETLELRLNPEDTAYGPGDFWYDIEMRLNNGFVDTIIPPTKFKITPQVKNVRGDNNG